MLELFEREDFDTHAEMPEQFRQLGRKHLVLTNRIKLSINDPEVRNDIGSVDLLIQRMRIDEKFSWLAMLVAGS